MHSSNIAAGFRPLFEKFTKEIGGELKRIRVAVERSQQDAVAVKEDTATFKVSILDKTLAFPGYPDRANPLDAGLDLRASEPQTVPANGRAVINTNLVIAVPEGHMGMVVPRSGNAKNYGVTVTNSPGIIDSGYRGEVKILLSNHSPVDFEVTAGDRIAQLILVPVSLMPVEPVQQIPLGERGTNGFGSSGR